MVKKTALEKFEEMCYFLAEWIKKLQFLRTFLSVYTTRKKLWLELMSSSSPGPGRFQVL